MTKIVPKLALFTLVLLGALSLSLATVRGEHDYYRFKWPYLPTASFSVTTYPYSGVHACPPGPGQSCTDAWDIVIAGDDVRSSAEGTAYDVFSNLDPGTCGPTLGLGNYVKVSVPNGPSVYYAHLTSTPVIEGSRILQGDDIGVQGNTGNTVGSDPGGCGTHLHFEFVPAHPDRIDNTSNPSQSSNTPVGDYNFPAAAIRQEYLDLGSVYGSWATVGWTADSTGSQAGCDPGSFCRLKVHYDPDAVEGHWGSKQDFRQHPEAAVFEGQSGTVEFSSIMAGRWAVNSAYWVEKPFFSTAWLLGAPMPGIDPVQYGRISLPLMDRIASSSGVMCGLVECCRSSVGCVRYQRFHVGYIWEHQTQGVKTAVFCPDVEPEYPNQNHQVNLFDMLRVSDHFGDYDRGSEPFDPQPGAWWDINGDGNVSIPLDILVVAGAFGAQCSAGGWT